MRFFWKASPKIVEPTPPPRPPYVVLPKTAGWITLTEEQRFALSAPIKIDPPVVTQSVEGIGQIIPFKAHQEKGHLPGAETDGRSKAGGHSAG
jgi:hypothetical protein